MSEPLLVFDHVFAGYGSEGVLFDVSASLFGGKITMILGENGCGKSTLLKTAVHLVKKTSGKIYIGGRDADIISAQEIAKNLSYLAQNKYIPDLTVANTVLLGRYAKKKNKRYSEDDILLSRQCMDMTGVAAYEDRRMSSLSGGIQQRAFLSMVLCQNARVLLMDEPTTFIDVSHQIELMQLCMSLRDEGKAVVMVMHDIPTAMRYADEIVIMENGRVVFCGSPDVAYADGVIDRTFNIDLKVALTPEGKIYYV